MKSSENWIFNVFTKFLREYGDENGISFGVAGVSPEDKAISDMMVFTTYAPALNNDNDKPCYFKAIKFADGEAYAGLKEAFLASGDEIMNEQGIVFTLLFSNDHDQILVFGVADKCPVPDESLQKIHLGAIRTVDPEAN